jgi:hypothetical protein
MLRSKSRPRSLSKIGDVSSLGESIIHNPGVRSVFTDVVLKVCRRVFFKLRIVMEADGAASALSFVAAGFGVAVVSEPLQKIPPGMCFSWILRSKKAAYPALGKKQP